MLQEVDNCVEAVAEAVDPPEVHQEVEETLGTEDDGLPGEQEEVRALALGEGLEGEIPI